MFYLQLVHVLEEEGTHLLFFLVLLDVELARAEKNPEVAQMSLADLQKTFSLNFLAHVAFNALVTPRESRVLSYANFVGQRLHWVDCSSVEWLARHLLLTIFFD